MPIDYRAEVTPSARIHHTAVIEKYAFVGPETHVEAGAHVQEDASIEHRARMGRDASVGPKTSLGKGAQVGAGSRAEIECRLEPGARLGDGATMMHRSTLGANSRVEPDAQIGSRVDVGPGAVVGARCRIPDDTRIEAGATIPADTVVRAGVTPGSAARGDEPAGAGRGELAGYVVVSGRDGLNDTEWMDTQACPDRASADRRVRALEESIRPHGDEPGRMYRGQAIYHPPAAEGQPDSAGRAPHGDGYIVTAGRGERVEWGRRAAVRGHRGRGRADRRAAAALARRRERSRARVRGPANPRRRARTRSGRAGPRDRGGTNAGAPATAGRREPGRRPAAGASRRRRRRSAGRRGAHGPEPVGRERGPAPSRIPSEEQPRAGPRRRGRTRRGRDHMHDKKAAGPTQRGAVGCGAALLDALAAALERAGAQMDRSSAAGDEARIFGGLLAHGICVGVDADGAFVEAAAVSGRPLRIGWRRRRREGYAVNAASVWRDPILSGTRTPPRRRPNGGDPLARIEAWLESRDHRGRWGRANPLCLGIDAWQSGVDALTAEAAALRDPDLRLSAARRRRRIDAGDAAGAAGPVRSRDEAWCETITWSEGTATSVRTAAGPRTPGAARPEGTVASLGTLRWSREDDFAADAGASALLAAGRIGCDARPAQKRRMPGGAIWRRLLRDVASERAALRVGKERGDA